MDNAELIKALRWCADESICCDDFSGEKCPYFDEKKDSCSVDEIMLADAAALEAAGNRIAELEAQLPKEDEFDPDAQRRAQRIFDLVRRMKEGMVKPIEPDHA